MKEELKVIHDRKVWTLVKPPKDISPLGCRWVYTIKRNEKGEIARFKCRLVAQGFKQVKGQTYEETFSPVVNFSIIRFFFSLLVSYMGWSHHQCDVKNAYLYAPLLETIYMKQPPGFSVLGKEDYICKLNKALYGLHQSGRSWYFEINKVLLDIGFKRFSWCNCVYQFENDIVLLLYVDDIVIFGKTEKPIFKVLRMLESHFDLKSLGKTKKLLGVEFEYENSLVLHQIPYIDDVYKRFQNFNPPITSLPIAKGSVYSKTQSPQSQTEIQEMKNYPYRNLLGCLSFLSSRTRPDIAYAVNIFSQFQANPGMIHWSGLLKLLGYVNSSKHLKLKLQCDKPNIVTFSDADFASNRDDRTSMGGQIVFLGSSPIMWRTSKQKSVCLSTMESEFVSMTDAVKELIWFDRILEECVKGKFLKGPKLNSLLYVDNQATIEFVKSPIENHRTKHIDVKLFFIRELFYDNAFCLRYVKSKDNFADAFTKPLTKNDLNRFLLKVFLC